MERASWVGRKGETTSAERSADPPARIRKGQEAADCAVEWALLDSNQGPTDYEAASNIPSRTLRIPTCFGRRTTVSGGTQRVLCYSERYNRSRVASCDNRRGTGRLRRSPVLVGDGTMIVTISVTGAQGNWWSTPPETCRSPRHLRNGHWDPRTLNPISARARPPTPTPSRFGVQPAAETPTTQTPALTPNQPFPVPTTGTVQDIRLPILTGARSGRFDTGAEIWSAPAIGPHGMIRPPTTATSCTLRLPLCLDGSRQHATVHVGSLVTSCVTVGVVTVLVSFPERCGT